MEILKKLSSTLLTRKDLALVLLLMIIISVMILPLPTYLMDALIVLNMSLTILILMVSIYLHKADDFSVFPAVILLATTFRLAISISTTRLILSQADAGDIIQTFGIFVTQGSVVVGLVIFTIITTVQFIVVTKGSERVAEVAARFTLDAMPGRQMSIDAELRNGDISQEEAARKRQELEKENKFFGAMDGAMKFVKGDAIAGIIIIIVNLAGGFGIGTIAEGMSAAEAASIYSRLTIGDGLVSQIPALLLAICAGIVITRVTTKDQADLGTDIVGQLTGSSKTLIIAGVILGLLSFVPGFPILLFMMAAAIFIISGLIVKRREDILLLEQQRLLKEQAASEKMASENQANAQGTPTIQTDKASMASADVKEKDIVSIHIGKELIKQIDKDLFISRRNNSIGDIEEKLGLFLPYFGYAENPNIDDFSFEINIEGVPVFAAKMEPDHLVVIAEKEILELLNVPIKSLDDIWPLRSAFWLAKEQKDLLKDGDVEIYNLTEILVDVSIYYLQKNAAQLIGFDQIEHILQLLKAEHSHLAQEVAQAANATQLLEIIRRLADESVPLYSRRLLFEGLLESIIKRKGSVDMSEQIRYALRRQISQYFANKDKDIACYVIEPDMESRLRKSLKNEHDARYLAIDAQTSNSFLSQIRRIIKKEDISVMPAVLVTSSEVRPHLRKFLANQNIDIDVLAFQEISSEFQLRPIGTISLIDSYDQTTNNQAQSKVA